MMEATAEVARISCLDEQSCFSLWNLKSGLQMKNFKGAQCGKHCITSVGNDYVFTAQDNKQVVHVWDFKKVSIKNQFQIHFHVLTFFNVNEITKLMSNIPYRATLF